MRWPSCCNVADVCVAAAEGITMEQNKENYVGWRRLGFKKVDHTQQTPCKPTRFFDRMSYIGDHSVCCFLLETPAGLVLVDCMWDSEHCLGLLEDGFAALGHSLSELKHIVITHAHQDHWGHANMLRAKYGCKIYMSRIDNIYGKHPDQTPGRRELKAMDWDADVLLEDGEVLDFGGTRLQCVLTPGHTPGCMSFIIDAEDCGEPHKVLLWGGTAIMVWTDPDEYLASVDKFAAVCAKEQADCYISNHPFVDLAYYKLDIINDIVDGVHNPFVATPDICQRYLDQFRKRALEAKEQRRLHPEFKQML